LHRIAFPVVSEWYQYRPRSPPPTNRSLLLVLRLSSQCLKGPGIVLVVMQVTW
jgi:hypothetical protein